MSLSPRYVTNFAPHALPLVDPVHHAVGAHHAVNEVAAHTNASHANVQAAVAGSHAAVATVQARSARTDTNIQQGRAVVQAHAAASADGQFHAATAAHAAASAHAHGASVDLSHSNAGFREAQLHAVASGSNLAAATASTALSSTISAEKQGVADATASRAVTLEQQRHLRAIEAEHQRTRAAGAKVEAANTAAAEQAHGNLAQDAHTKVQVTRARAAEAEAQHTAAEARRAELASAAAAAQAAAHVAAQAERAASIALAAAAKESDVTRAAAQRARTEAAAADAEFRTKASHHGIAQVHTANAVHRAASEDAAATVAHSTFITTDNLARTAAVQAGTARSDAAAAHVNNVHQTAQHRAAAAQHAEAHLSAQRAGRNLEASEVQFSRAASHEALARANRDQSMVVASVERQRHFGEEAALSAARTREVHTNVAELDAHNMSSIANVYSAGAQGAAHAASVTRAVHDVATPRMVFPRV